MEEDDTKMTPVKNTLLDVLKTSRKSIPKEFLEIQASQPFLSAPSERPLNSSRSPAEKTHVTLAQSYDSTFVKMQSEYAKELVKKGKFIKPMQTKNFSQQILFAYCYPKEKHLNRIAKKFAHQATKRSLKLLTQKQPQVLENYGPDRLVQEHREQLKNIVEYALKNCYRMLFNDSLASLAESQCKVLSNLLFHPEMKSYLEPKTQELFYTLEKSAAAKAREIYGAPFDYDIQMKGCQPPNTVHAWIFSEEVDWFSLLKDHLSFYEAYQEQLNKQHPPLLQQEKQQLIEAALDADTMLPESLRTTHEICCRESRSRILAQSTGLLPSWNYDPETLSLALEIAHCLNEPVKREVLKKQIQEQVLHHSSRYEKQLEKAVDNSSFLLQLENRLGPIDATNLQNMIDRTVNAEADPIAQAIHASITATQRIQKLSQGWKPSIQTMQALVQGQTPWMLRQKLTLHYLHDYVDMSCQKIQELFHKNSQLSQAFESLQQLFSEVLTEAEQAFFLNQSTHPKSFPLLSETYRSSHSNEQRKKAQILEMRFDEWMKEPLHQEAVQRFGIQAPLKGLIQSSVAPSYTEMLSYSRGDAEDSQYTAIKKYLDQTFPHLFSEDFKKEFSALIVVSKQAFSKYLVGEAPDLHVVQSCSQAIEALIFEKFGNLYEAQIARLAALELLESMLTILATSLILLNTSIHPVTEVSSSFESPFKRELPLPEKHDLLETICHQKVKEDEQDLKTLTQHLLSKQIHAHSPLLAKTLIKIYKLSPEFQDTLTEKIASTVLNVDELLAPTAYDDSLSRSMKRLASYWIAQEEDPVDLSPIRQTFNQYFRGVASLNAVDLPELFCSPQKNVPESMKFLCRDSVMDAVQLELLKGQTSQSRPEVYASMS